MKNITKISSLIIASGLTSCGSLPEQDFISFGIKDKVQREQKTVHFPVEKKPNVLLMIVDDQGYADFSYKGLEEGVITPNLDRLMAESVVFDEGYASAPICSPSRCGLLTGNYQQRYGNFWFGGPGMPSSAPTMAREFNALGYETSHIGKLHYGMDLPANCPVNQGFNYSLAASHGGRAHYLYHSEDAVNRYGVAAGVNRMEVRPMRENGKEVDRDGFTTEIFSNKALEKMQEAVNNENPFFIQLAFNAVHNFTWQLPKEYLEEWGLPEMPDWDPEKEPYNTWYDKHIRPNLENGRAYYLAQLYYMDKEVGKLLDYLDEAGIRDNTIVVWTSDNGGSMCNWGINTPLRGSKYTLYEGGIRVPYFISWRNTLKAQTIENEAVISLDLMPTLLEAAGAQFFGGDGQSLLPLMRGETSGLDRDTLVWDAGWTYAVRKENWKLKVVTNAAMSKGLDYEHTNPGLGVELFNLEDDLSETTNLASQYPEKVAELKRCYRQWKKAIK